MQCPVCKNEVSGNMKFCSKCGARLPEIKYCPSCGGVITADMKFCRNCGAPNALYNENNTSRADEPVAEYIKHEVPAEFSNKVDSKPETTEIVSRDTCTEDKVSDNQDIDDQVTDDQVTDDQISEHQVPEASVSEDTFYGQDENSDGDEYFPEDYEQPTRKSRKGLVITVIICLIAIIGMGAYYYVMIQDKPSQEPKDAKAEVAVDSTPRRFESEVDSDLNAGPQPEEISAPQPNRMGFHSGTNSFNADMIHTDGRRFPFDLSLNYNPGGDPQITDAVYYNPSAGTKVKLKVDVHKDNFIRLSGTTGGKAFILEFRGSNPYTGDAWWGDFHQDIEMSLK